jgi:tRNA 2-selenouridine synthase
MRTSNCISLTLSRQHRVQLLMEDYVHFTRNPEILNTQLDCLLSLHGREKIMRWHQMSNAGEMPELVDELLQDHYDPAYLRSIERNFTRFLQADILTLDTISDSAFLAAAQQLHNGSFQPVKESLLDRV